MLATVYLLKAVYISLRICLTKMSVYSVTQFYNLNCGLMIYGSIKINFSCSACDKHARCAIKS